MIPNSWSFVSVKHCIQGFSTPSVNEKYIKYEETRPNIKCLNVRDKTIMHTGKTSCSEIRVILTIILLLI